MVPALSNGRVLIGDLPGGVCTGLRKLRDICVCTGPVCVERYMVGCVCTGLRKLRDIWWDVLVLGLFVLSPGLRNVPDFFQSLGLEPTLNPG